MFKLCIAIWLEIFGLIFISYNFTLMVDNIVHDMVECYLAVMWNSHASLNSSLLSFSICLYISVRCLSCGFNTNDSSHNWFFGFFTVRATNEANWFHIFHVNNL